jgi:hypothetical protein
MTYSDETREDPTRTTEDDHSVDTLDPAPPEDQAPADGLDRTPNGGAQATDVSEDAAQPVDSAWRGDTEHPDDEGWATAPDEPGVDGEAPPDGSADAERSEEAAAATGWDADNEPATESERIDESEPTAASEQTIEGEPPPGDGRWSEGERPAEGEHAMAGETAAAAAGGAALAHDASETEPVAGTDEGPAEENTELMPGDVPVEPVTGLWGDDAADGFRERWRAVQLRFVDDPHGAADEAAGLVGEAVDELTASLSRQRGGLDDWRSSAGDTDTERLRMAVQRYREFLDRVLEL